MSEHTDPAAPRYAGPHMDGDWTGAPAVPVLAEPVAGPHWSPGPPLPTPVAPSPSASAPARYPHAPDGSSAWASRFGEPGAVPAPIPGIEGPHTRSGWLTRGRDADGPPTVA